MKQWLSSQKENAFLYLPFLMAGGAALYFSMQSEPVLLFPHIICAILFISMFINRIPYFIRAIVIFIFGFYYAAIFTNQINTPQMQHNISDITINAQVQSIDYTDDKFRLYLNVPAQDINAGTGNANIRISVSKDISTPNIGDVVQINAALFRPSLSYAPETFDYARWAYFNNLTATGYAKELSVINSSHSYNLNSARDWLHRQSDSFLVDTLVLGYKGAISSSDDEIWNTVGIGHVWSISGFHMTLVGGWLFAIFYTIFRAIPFITRRIPAKIPALICAWIGLMLYLFLSGADVATVRAFLMTTLIFAAFIIGRSAISMRNISLVFCAIFLMNPHCVMQAGFQLSFAAVFGLIWLYSDIKPKMPQNKVLKITYAAALTSLVATIFTLPFIAVHFGKIPTYGLLGNLILLPIFSVVIMPLVLIGTLIAPLDCYWPLQAANNVYNFTLDIAQHISDLPMAQINAPHIPNIALVCFILAFIFLILIKSAKIKENYILFGIFLGTGLILTYTTPKPVFYSSHDNELVAFIGTDGTLEFNKSRASNHYFAFDTWKKINGENIATTNKRKKHVKGVYEYKTENFNLVYIQKFVPLMNNIERICNDDNIDFVVSYFDINSDICRNKVLQGGFVIYPDKSVKYTPIKRRWHYSLHE